MLPAVLDWRDPVVNQGLARPIKYVRLVRRKLGERHRFYAQLVCQGMPFRKPQHTLGKGVVGLDLGPSAIAVVSAQQALLQPFCPEVAPDEKALRRLDRKLDRQQRANNPTHYDEHGQVKKGRKRWHVSTRQRTAQARRREFHRKLAATRKRSHGRLAHQVLALGDTFQLEHLSYRVAPGTGPMASRCSAVPQGCSSSGCLVWLEVLAGPSCRSIPGEPGYPKRAIVAGSRRKPAPSVGIPVAVGPVPSATSSRPGWHASWIQTPPCSAWVRRTRPGRGGSPPCKRRMSRPSTTNPRGAGGCLPPLVGLRSARVRVGRLQKGRVVGPEGADAVASVARAAQRGR